MLKIGDKVKPVETFDFENYHGPADMEDRGVVVDIFEQEGKYGSILYIEWERGRKFSDHVAEDHTGHPNDSLEDFGVEAA